MLSLMDGRRTRSMSTLTSQRNCPASPLLENENPFRGLSSETVAHYEIEVIKSQRRKERPNSEIQKRPQRKLGRRLAQSMLIESSSDIELIPVTRTLGKSRHVLSNSSYAIPYKCDQIAKNTSLVSLLSLPRKIHDDKYFSRENDLTLSKENCGSTTDNQPLKQNKERNHGNSDKQKENIEARQATDIKENEKEVETKNRIKKKKRNVLQLIYKVINSKLSKEDLRAM